MKTVHVTASKEYDVLIGSGLLRSIGSFVADFKNISKVCIVSDSNVWPLYGQTAVLSLTSAGFDVNHYIVPAGEDSKNAQTYFDLITFLAENRMTRTDLIVALGGGVVGDLAGFAAATYLRGIPYIQVPTTLLAAVDSSVGGKTAIDLPAGKNLLGAFYQPGLVICDTDCLDTLPADTFRDGCAEVIKYGILYDPALFQYLSHTGPDFDRENVITRCVELKRDAVAADEFDTGARMKLNLGHTIGHAVESLSGYSVSHGNAVAIGTAIMTRAACVKGLCSGDTTELILDTLNKFGLPCTTEFTARQLCDVAGADKKRQGGNIRLIVPRSVGDCMIESLPVDELESFIQAGL